MSEQTFKELVLLSQTDYNKLTDKASQSYPHRQNLPLSGVGHQTHALNPSLATASDVLDGSVGSVSGGQVNNIELAAPGSKVVIEADPSKKGSKEIVASTRRAPSISPPAAAAAAGQDSYTQTERKDASTTTFPPQVSSVGSQTFKPRLISKKVQTVGTHQSDRSAQTLPNKRVSFGAQTFSPSTHASGVQTAGPRSVSTGTQAGPAISRGVSSTSTQVSFPHHFIMDETGSVPPPYDRRVSVAPGMQYPEVNGFERRREAAPLMEELNDTHPLYHHQELINNQTPYIVELPPDEDEPMPQQAITGPQFLPITHEQASTVARPLEDNPSQAGKMKKGRRSKVFKKGKPAKNPPPPPAADPSSSPVKRKRGRPRKKQLSAEEEEALHEHVRARLRTLTGGRERRSASKSAAAVSEPKVKSLPKTTSKPNRGKKLKRLRSTRTTDPDVMSERIVVPHKTRRTTGSLPGPRRRHYDEWIQ